MPFLTPPSACEATHPSEAPPTDKGPVVGQSVPRLDSPDTVTGAAKYAADLKMDGMLHAKLLRSPHHHARIRSIDTSEAKALPGVAAVITADDVPGTPFLPNCQPQVYVFPKDKVRFLGEAVAAVAADTVDTADSALARIKVDYEPLPPVVGPDGTRHAKKRPESSIICPICGVPKRSSRVTWMRASPRPISS